jgi:hypothetical protein
VVASGSLERPHVLSAREALPGLGNLHYVVLVPHVVFHFGAEVGQQLREEAVRLLLVHLFEVGDLLSVHLVHCGFSSIV